jgi:hypothetical protein
MVGAHECVGVAPWVQAALRLVYHQLSQELAHGRTGRHLVRGLPLLGSASDDAKMHFGQLVRIHRHHTATDLTVAGTMLPAGNASAIHSLGVPRRRLRRWCRRQWFARSGTRWGVDAWRPRLRTCGERQRQRRNKRLTVRRRGQRPDLAHTTSIAQSGPSTNQGEKCGDWGSTSVSGGTLALRSVENVQRDRVGDRVIASCVRVHSVACQVGGQRPSRRFGIGQHRFESITASCRVPAATDLVVARLLV